MPARQERQAELRMCIVRVFGRERRARSRIIHKINCIPPSPSPSPSPSVTIIITIGDNHNHHLRFHCRIVVIAATTTCIHPHNRRPPTIVSIAVAISADKHMSPSSESSHHHCLDIHGLTRPLPTELDHRCHSSTNQICPFESAALVSVPFPNSGVHFHHLLFQC